MDEKIRKAYSEWINHGTSYTDEVSAFADSVENYEQSQMAWHRAAGLYAGYRAALDALPSRYAIEDTIFANSVQTINKDGEFLWVVNQGNLLNAIDELIRGKE